MSDSFVGATTVAQDASEAIADIPRNRTMFIQQLTGEAPMRPSVVQGLRNVNEVFAHFQPSVEVEFSKNDGSLTEETLNFTNVGDFSPEKIKQQSQLLRDLATQQELYGKITKQLRSNKLLGNVLSKDESKQAMLDSLRALIQELKDADQK